MEQFLAYLDNFLAAASVALGYAVIILPFLIGVLPRIMAFRATAENTFEHGSKPDEVIEFIYSKIDFIDDYVTPENAEKVEKLKDKLDGYRKYEDVDSPDTRPG